MEQWPARRAHNPKVGGSNPSPATNSNKGLPKPLIKYGQLIDQQPAADAGLSLFMADGTNMGPILQKPLVIDTYSLKSQA